MKKFYQQIPTFKLTLWQLNLLISILFVAVFNVYLWHDLMISLQPESFVDYAFFAIHIHVAGVGDKFGVNDFNQPKILQACLRHHFYIVRPVFLLYRSIQHRY
jgi:hypothetical protein